MDTGRPPSLAYELFRLLLAALLSLLVGLCTLTCPRESARRL
jgi:hypothetical protein